jgi:hypothetical protein
MQCGIFSFDILQKLRSHLHKAMVAMYGDLPCDICHGQDLCAPDDDYLYTAWQDCMGCIVISCFCSSLTHTLT